MAKILIFTSHGGGGHISASNAIHDYLKEQHEVITVPIFASSLKSIDPIKFFTFKKYNCEDAYNYFLKKRWIRLLNGVTKLTLAFVPLIAKTLQNLINKHIEFYRPDLIISVIPIVNQIVYRSAQHHHIPFLLIPTDLDVSTFIHNLQVGQRDSFFLGLAFDDPALLKITQKINIARHKIGITGFPLRKSFFEPKNKMVLRRNFSIPDNKPVILLLMGAVGSQVILRYLKELSLIHEPFHIIVCVGRNESLKAKISSIQFAKGISISVFGFVDNIADLMAVSDFCITKPGSVSVCEAIYMNLPLILDGTCKSLLWENFNLHFIENHRFGTVIREIREVKSVVLVYLQDASRIEDLRLNLESYRKERFDQHVKALVETMLKDS